jgi:hypothetical protein
MARHQPDPRTRSGLPDRKPGNFDNSTEEYGDLLALSLPLGPSALSIFGDYRRVVPTNPCLAAEGRDFNAP